MTKAELEKIKNHISNIPTIAPIYVPELIAGVEEALSDATRHQEASWAWCLVANERALERERLRSALRLLWEQAVDICGPAGATIRRAFTAECRAAVAAALGEDALTEDNQ